MRWGSLRLGRKIVQGKLYFTTKEERNKNVNMCISCALVWYVRRSTIEVQPYFSEAPHLRSSIPRPKIDFSKNQLHTE